MLYELKIKLKTPFLGDKQTKDRIRKFSRSDNGDLVLDTAKWQFVMSAAIESLGMSVNPEAVRLPLEFRTPKLNLYTRRWRDQQGLHSEDFECIQKGTVLTIKVLSMNKSENSNQPGPSREELFYIFEFIGHWIGLSPWGSKYNYGRFDVLELTEYDKNTIRRGSSDSVPSIGQFEIKTDLSS